MKSKIIFIVIVALITTAIFSCKKNQKPKNHAPMNSNHNPVYVSSFDLNVYIPKPDSNFEEKWIAEFKKYGLEVEIHPGFDINNQQGFLPFKLIVQKNNKYVKSKHYHNKVILTGYELDVSKFDSEDYFSYFEEDELKKLSQEYKDKLKKCELNLFFSVNPSQNTSEYRIAWFTAATLTKLYNGVLSDPQQGVDYIGQEAINKAIELSDKFENSIPDNQWKLYDFKKWN